MPLFGNIPVQISGLSGLQFTTVVKTANYTIQPTDFAVEVSATSGNLTISLPSNGSGAIKGSTFCVIKTDNSANTVTIQPNGSETINGAGNFAITAQWQSIYIQALSNGDWAIVSTSVTSESNGSEGNGGGIDNSNAVLLCNFNGANNSTSFTDLKGHLIVGNGNPKISTTKAIVGGSSLYLDGASTLSILNSPDFNFGSGDFTIAFWLYLENATLYSSILMRDGSDYPLAIYCGNYNSIVSLSAGTNSSWFVTSVSAGAFITNTWVHYAFVRIGDNFMAFKDGVVQDVKTASGVIAEGTANMVLGGVGTHYLTGYMNRLEIHKSAIYTANFTPSVEPLAI